MRSNQRGQAQGQVTGEERGQGKNITSELSLFIVKMWQTKQVDKSQIAMIRSLLSRQSWCFKR